MNKRIVFLTIIFAFVTIMITSCQLQAPIADIAADELAENSPEIVSRGGSVTEVRIYGQEGFDKDEVNIKVGDRIKFINDNSAREIVTLVFKYGTSLTNSGFIEYGEFHEKTFEEPGVYEFWTVGYGIKAKVFVE